MPVEAAVSETTSPVTSTSQVLASAAPPGQPATADAGGVAQAKLSNPPEQAPAGHPAGPLSKPSSLERSPVRSPPTEAKPDRPDARPAWHEPAHEVSSHQQPLDPSGRPQAPR